MRKRSIVIPAEISGSGDLFVDPSNVNEVVNFHPSIFLCLQNEVRVELKPELAVRKIAMGTMLTLLFSEEVRDKGTALARIMRDWINVENIQNVNYRGGSVWLVMTDGQQICSRPCGFHDYKAAVTIIYGQAAAAELKPAVPEPLVLEQKPQPPVRKPTLTIADWYDGNNPIAKAAEPIIAKKLPKITTSDPTQRSAAIGGVVDSLELVAIGLQARAHVTGQVAEGPSVLASRVQALRIAHCQLMMDDTAINLARVKSCADEVTSVAWRLPSDESGQVAKVRIAEQCARLSDMPQSQTVSDLDTDEVAA